MNNVSHEMSLKSLQNIHEDQYWSVQADSNQKGAQVIVRIPKDTRGTIKKIGEFSKVLIATQHVLKHESNVKISKDKFKEIGENITERYNHLKIKIGKLPCHKRICLWLLEKRYRLDRNFLNVLDILDKKGVDVDTSVGTKDKVPGYLKVKQKLGQMADQAKKRVTTIFAEANKSSEKTTPSTSEQARKSEKDSPSKNTVKKKEQDTKQKSAQDAKQAGAQADKSVKGASSSSSKKWFG